MKRIFTYIAMLTLTVACSELYGPEETPLTPDSAAGVEITFSDVTDNSFKVTVAPTSEASYYSYLVDQSDAAATLDPAALYAVKYSSITQGTVNWEKSSSHTFEVTDVDPNKTYQVYAVAGSPMGIVGTVVSKSVKTTDGVTPELADYEAADGILSLIYSEDVTVAEGAVTLRYFARQTENIGNDIAEGTYTVPADSIECVDNTVILSFEGEIPAGAYYTADYPAGFVVDSANNPVAELKSGFTTTEDGLAPYGVYGRMDFTTWEFDTYEQTVFTDPSQYFYLTSAAAQICKYGEATASVTFAKGSKTTTIALSPGVNYACGLMTEDPESDVAMFSLPEAPDYGSVVTITVPEDTFWDIYGNSNAEFEVSCLLSFGYTLEDVIGTYSGQANSYWDGPVDLAFTIAASDNAEYGNVMITGSYMGLPCSDGNIYGDFDCDGGILRLYSGQTFYVDSSAGPVFFAVNGADYVDIKMPESGVLTSPSALFGAYIKDTAWYDAFTSCYLEKQAADAGVAAAAASVPELVGKAL